jgi:ribonuclease HII
MLLKKFSTLELEAGADEAGRGCLAGPVTAAVVILKIDFDNELLNDSKKLTEKARYSLRPLVEKAALTFSITHLCPLEIDGINILNASMKAMQECVLKLNKTPQFIIVDGNRALNTKIGLNCAVGKKFSDEEIAFLTSIPTESIVRGDGTYLSIAAASVLAKTYRDDYMNTIHEEFPMYNWKKNKGYPTKEHREAIKKYGVTKYHRMSFRLLPDQLDLDL